MHILIVMRSAGYYRFVESIIEEIAERGGRVTLVSRNLDTLLERVGGPLPEGVSFEEARPNRRWSAGLLRLTRELRSYLHWLRLRTQPDFLLDRWLQYMPRPMRSILRLARRLHLEWLLTDGRLSQAFSWFENVTIPGRNIFDQIRDVRPDAVLVTPLLYPGAWEVDYLKACRQGGQAHAALVASWDNLTSKGVFHVEPDLVLVWNDIQVGEALEYHSIAGSGVVPIGAPVFDWMFTGELLQSREEFCYSVGLDPACPYIVYAVSSAINCGDETAIVRNLHGHLESLAPGHIQVLVRPYPSGQAGWDGFASSGIRVGFPPTMGRRLVKSNLLNTLYHSAAVVGLNTSVLLEAAILDRPGVTLLFNDAGHDPILNKHTHFPHFDYLLRGGFLDVVEDERNCAERIIEIVHGSDRKKEARAAFVHRFIRPNGLETPASHAVVNLFERLAASRSCHAADATLAHAMGGSQAGPVVSIR